MGLQQSEHGSPHTWSKWKWPGAQCHPARNSGTDNWLRARRMDRQPRLTL